MDEDKVLAALSLIANRLDSMEASLEGKITHLDGKITHLDGKVTDLDGKVTDLRVVMMTRFERIENKLTSMSEDMQVTMGAASIGLQQREGDRRDLAVFVDAVTLIQRKLLRLQTDVEELQKKAS